MMLYTIDIVKKGKPFEELKKSKALSTNQMKVLKVVHITHKKEKHRRRFHQ